MLTLLAFCVLAEAKVNDSNEYPLFFFGAGATLDLSIAGIDNKYIHDLVSFTPLRTDMFALCIQTRFLFNFKGIQLRIPIVGNLELVRFPGGELLAFFGAGVCFDFIDSACYWFMTAGLEIVIQPHVIAEIGSNALAFSYDGVDAELFASIAFFF
jgi:hypothetical protein